MASVFFIQDRHEIHDLAKTVIAVGTRHKNRAFGQVLLFEVDPAFGGDGKAAPDFIVQYGRKNARGVKGRQAAPVNGPVDTDESYCMQVADDSVILDAKVRHAGVVYDTTQSLQA